MYECIRAEMYNKEMCINILLFCPPKFNHFKVLCKVKENSELGYIKYKVQPYQA
jgi:hypothetical protein